MPMLSDHSGLRRYLPMLVFVFCIMQPLMDVASFFLNRFHLSNLPMLVLRTGLLLGMTLCGFVLTRRKKVYYAVFLLLGSFTALHILACLQAGYSNPVEDLGNQLRIFQFPLTCLAFLTFLREDDRVAQVLPRAMACCFGSIVLVMVASTLTGTDPHTYQMSGNGVCGWFYSGSCQSAILSMLVPVTLLWSLKKGNIPLGLTALLCFGSLYFFGTRLAYAAIFAIAGCFFVGLLLLDRKRYALSACIVLLCAVVFAAAFPLSPMVAQQSRHGAIVQERQARIDRMYAEVLEQEGQQAAYDAVYREYAPELTGRFGTATIEEAYDYSLSYATISGVRAQKLLFGNLLMAESSPMTRLFGLELNRFTYNGVVFDVENDFHGIYYLCGWVGLGLMLLLFGGFVWVLVAGLLRQFREFFTPVTLALSVAFCCGLVHAVFTAGVLRRNNASVYLGLIMAWAWYLLRRTPKERSFPE